jgi:hypothetical protein
VILHFGYTCPILASCMLSLSSLTSRAPRHVMLIHMQNGASGIWAVQLKLCWSCFTAATFHLPPMLTTATMAGAARELSGPKDNPRSSRSRFRGCRRNSQIHCSTGHAVILSMMGWQLQDSNLPAQAVFLDSGHEKSTEVYTTGAHQRGSASYLSSRPEHQRVAILQTL